MNKKLLGFIFSIAILFAVVGKANAAYVNITGFETGDTFEAAATSGTISVQNTTVRTGSYALRANPTASTGYAEIQKMAATGAPTVLNIGSAGFYGAFYFRRANAPGVQTSIMRVMTNSGTEAFAIDVDTSGNLHSYWRNSSNTRVEQGTQQATSTNTWYRIEFLISGINTSGGTVEWKVNGTSISNAFLGQNTNATTYNSVRYGVIDSTTADFYFDDISINDSAYPGPGRVAILKPNAAGTNAGWTNGSGSTFAVVDEVPSNSDTDYLMNVNTSGTHDFNMEDSSTIGALGTIGAVKLVGIVRNVAAGAGSIALWSRSSATNVSETAWTTGSTSYLGLGQIKNTTNSGAAWTSVLLDALQVGVVQANANDARATALYAIVWHSGEIPSITTTAATSVTTTTAVLHATYNPNALSTDQGYRYGTSNVACSSLASSFVDNSGSTGTSDINSSATASSLTPGTLYYYCGYATNAIGTTYGSVMTFTTSPDIPTITTPTSASITGFTALLGGNVTVQGGSAVTAKGICYALTATNAAPQNGGSGVTCVPQGTGGTGVFTQTVSGLTQNSNYSYEAYATNTQGTAYTSAGTFSTPNVNPTGVDTNAPTGVNSYYVTLSGVANPNAYTSTGHFRVYGSAPANCTSDTGGTRYPASAGSDVSIGADSSPHTFTYTIPPDAQQFLTPNTTYWYCSYAINTNGTVGGATVASFTTSDGPNSPCDPPTSGNLVVPALATCNFSGNLSGVDAGTGTRNTGGLTLGAGSSVTISSSQQIAFGSIGIQKPASFTLAHGATLRGGGVYVHDKDGDGILDDKTQYIGSTASASTEFRRRNLIASTYNYGWKMASASASVDCDPNSANVSMRVVGNFISDVDHDGYKTAPAATSNPCVGPTQLNNGRVYFRDTAGNYSWLNSTAVLGGGTTDCDDTNAGTTTGATYYQDSDGDTYGNNAVSQAACSQPGGYVANNTDCLDSGSCPGGGGAATCYQNLTGYTDGDTDGYGGVQSSVGASSPTNFGSDSSVGSANWSNATNMLSSNNVYSTVNLTSTTIAYYIIPYIFNFNIPVGATITGVKAEIERHASGLTVTDYSVKLNVNGLGVTGVNKASAAAWATSDPNTYVTYGGDGDTWGIPLTRTDVNASPFGLAISVKSSTTRTASIDHVRMTVYYTINTSSSICSGASLPSGYSANNTDCNPTDGSFYQTDSGLYTDGDGDGTIGTTTYTVCKGAGTPAGWSSSTGADCNDLKRGATTTRTCYADSDNDTFTLAGSSSVCAGSSCTALIDGQASGFQTSASGSVDCYDQNSDVFPGQTAYFSTPTGSGLNGGYDFDCNNSSSKATYDQCAAYFFSGWVLSGGCNSGGSLLMCGTHSVQTPTEACGQGVASNKGSYIGTGVYWKDAACSSQPESQTGAYTVACR